MDEVAFLVWDMPERLLDAAVGEARSRDSSLNDVIVGALAAHLNVEWKPLGGRFRYTATGQKRIVRMSPHLRRRLRRRAKARKMTMRGVVLLALAERFDLEPEPPQRRRTK